jgi:hypothetical protein
MALSNSNEFDDLIEECLGLLLKEGSLQYIEKELIGGETDNNLLIIKNCPLSDHSIKNEDYYINKQYENFYQQFNISLFHYSYVLFVIVFCSDQTFREISNKLSLENIYTANNTFLWYSSVNNKEFIESFKEFLYPVSIKPAKRS